MKRILLIVAILGLLIFDWLALDDITTGNQPSFFWEYALLGVSIILVPIFPNILRFFAKQSLLI